MTKSSLFSYLLARLAAGRAGIPGGRVTGTVGRPGFRSLALLASIVVSCLAASSAPTPLYATYASEWHFSPITTTVVFGAYAIAVLLALLVFGRISDNAGRRPVLVAALALQVVAMVVLATAGGVAALVAGRVIQGLATGAAMGALGAAMLDVDQRRGALANAAAPGMGTGVGSLLSGLLVQYVGAPTHLVFLLLIGVFVLQGAGVVLMRETVAPRPGLRAALVPELAVPQRAHGALIAAAPILFAVWALAGFYGSLGPALARQLTGSTSAVVGGLGFFLLAIAGSLATILLNRTPPRTVMLIGIAVLVLAGAGTLAAVEESSAPGFFLCTVVAGLGFGAGFQGGIRTVAPLAAPHERAAVLSVLYVVCYCGMGIPAAIAGVLAVHGGGLVSAARDYVVFIMVLAVAALAGLARQRRALNRAACEDRGRQPVPRSDAGALAGDLSDLPEGRARALGPTGR